MFRAKSSTPVCPACGQENRAAARFCVACAARLGAEPSIAPAAAPATAPAAIAGHADSYFDAPRTVHSRPLPLSAAPANNAGFWLKFCIAGLVVMIGFIGWSLYILTGSKAPMQLPVGSGSVAAPSVAASPAPTASPSPAPTPAPAAVAVAAPSVAAAPAAAPATHPPLASWTVPPEAQRPAAATAARQAGQRLVATRERTRPAPNEVRPADFGGWVEPSRPPGMTSSPNYQDAGPPVVPGPGPREFAAPTQAGGNVAATGR